MSYCPSCGALNEDGSAFCQRCGASLRGESRAPGYAPPPPADKGLDSNDKTWIFLGTLCISPLLGIVLYFVWKDSKPRKAKDVCTLTWWTFAVWAVLIGIIIAFAFAGAMMEGSGS